MKHGVCRAMRGNFTDALCTWFVKGKVRSNIVPIGGTIRKLSRNFVGSRKIPVKLYFSGDLRQANPACPSRAGRAIAEAALILPGAFRPMPIQASERFELKLSADQQAGLIRRAKQLGVTRGALVRELILQPAPSETGASSGAQEQLTVLAEQLQELLTLARAAALLAPQGPQGQIGSGSASKGSLDQGSPGASLGHAGSLQSDGSLQGPLANSPALAAALVGIQTTVARAVDTAFIQSLASAAGNATKAIDEALKSTISNLYTAQTAINGSSRTIENAGRWFAFKWVAVAFSALVGVCLVAYGDLAWQRSQVESLTRLKSELSLEIVNLQAGVNALKTKGGKIVWDACGGRLCFEASSNQGRGSDNWNPNSWKNPVTMQPLVIPNGY